MEWLRPDIEEEFNKVESSIKRFMKRQYPWIEDIMIDKEKFQKNKMSASIQKVYDVSIVIDKKNLEMLRNNEGLLDLAEEQFNILFKTVIESLSTFDHNKRRLIYLDVTPVIQDFN